MILPAKVLQLWRQRTCSTSIKPQVSIAESCLLILQSEYVIHLQRRAAISVAGDVFLEQRPTRA
jgi:hypothetical protein